MIAIETLIRKCGQDVVYATHQGRRVTPRNAYLADAVTFAPMSVVHTVECAPVGMRPFYEHDHHRQGDVGYDAPAEQAPKASALGQVVSALACIYDPDIPGSPLLTLDWVEGYEVKTGDITFNGEWVVGTYCVPSLIVPRDLVVTAACDHNLAGAWAGRVPGVTRMHVADFRARTSAKDEATYEYDFRTACIALERAPLIALGKAHVRDMREHTVPELPDAACYQGEAYLAKVSDRDGRCKIVLGGATTPKDVIAFRDHWAPRAMLSDIYAMPDRGIAGGYL